jgi:tetraacyldisaccharide 4'-kinase
MAGAAPSRWAQALLDSWALPRPNTLARLLQPLAWCHGLLVALRRTAYQRGWLARQAAPVPVLVVGNWVAGGAGKTPTVIMLLPRLRALGFTPGVVSRGHGRQGSQPLLEVTRQSTAADVGDEPLLIHLRSGAPVVVGADRVAAAAALCARHPEVDLLVTDDGLQHLRLARNAQLVVFDERGAGNGLLLPAGPLREPLPRRLPSRTAVLYTVPAPSTALPGCTGQRRLAGVQPLARWWEGDDADAAAPGADPWAALRGRPVLATAGLARPEPFFAMLEAQGLTILRLPLPDHARFDPLPWPPGTADVVLTEKDAVKLPPHRVVGTRVWVARLDFDPEPAFDAALRSLCAHCTAVDRLPESPRP